MACLKDYVFLTGWIALPFTVWGAIAQLRNKRGVGIDWTWTIIILTFGITLESRSRHPSISSRETLQSGWRS